MSQAFLNGFRASHNMGMGDIRTPQMRSLDQARTQSGNPSLAYNVPRFQGTAMPPQQAQMPVYRAPVLTGMPPQVAQMPVAPQGYRAPSGPMFTNLNAGRFGRNRPLNQ